jgi:hypothetical protein
MQTQNELTKRAAKCQGFLQKYAAPKIEEEGADYTDVAMEGLGHGLFITGLPGALGATLAGVYPTRSEKAQRDRGTSLKNIIPGVGSYNHYKRLGRTAKDYEDSPEKK